MTDWKALMTASAMALCFVVPGVTAQETETVTQEPAAMEQGETGITLGLELLGTLSEEEALMAAAMDDINGGIERALEDSANANATFDAMVEAVERMAEFGNPEGRFVANIEATIALAREIFIEAREIGDEEVMAQMEAEIASLEVMRETALELYSDSFRSIRDIEAQRSRFVLRIRANLLQQAREIAENGLEIVRQHNARLDEIRIAAIGDEEDEVISE